MTASRPSKTNNKNRNRRVKKRNAVINAAKARLQLQEIKNSKTPPSIYEEEKQVETPPSPTETRSPSPPPRDTYLSTYMGSFFAPPDEESRKLDETLTDFVIIKPNLTRHDPYDAAALDCLIQTLLTQKNGFNLISKHSKENRGTIYTLYEKAGQTLAVFDVVKDSSENNDAYHGFFSLQEALETFKNNNPEVNSLFIPVACLLWRHYRLLEIKLQNNKATFYDSKSTLATALSSVGATTLTTCASFFCPEESLEQFKESYCYIKSTCQTIYPELQVSETSLGHQQFYNNIDCGVYTVAYVDLLAQGKTPQDLSQSVEVLRLEQQELLSGRAIDQDYEPGMAGRFGGMGLY